MRTRSTRSPGDIWYLSFLAYLALVLALCRQPEKPTLTSDLWYRETLVSLVRFAGARYASPRFRSLVLLLNFDLWHIWYDPDLWFSSQCACFSYSRSFSAPRVTGCLLEL